MSGERAAICIAACAACACLCQAPAAAQSTTWSELALERVVQGTLGEPSSVLAQRTIVREWGLSPDSSYTVIDVPEWRSEALAVGLSAAVPGTGQYYVGDGTGLWFMLVEAAAWTGHIIWRNDADQTRGEAETFAGDPNVSSSNWSFERWASATNQDVDELRSLYRADPNSFYLMIGRDARYSAGWAGPTDQTLGEYQSIQDLADTQRNRSRMAAGVLWLNHIAAAAHAFRAARLHNLPLQRNLELQLKPTWNGGGPGMMAVVEKTF